MPRRGGRDRGFLIISASLLFAALISSLAASAASPAPYVEDEVVIKYKGSASPAMREQVGRSSFLATRERMPQLGIERMKIRSGSSVEKTIADCYSRWGDIIEYAEPNYIVNASLQPNDPYFGEMSSLHNTGQNGGLAGADISALAAWDIATGGNVIVAVIDSGVDYNHPDLAGNIWVNSGEIPGNGIDDDGNGFVDDCRGWDFFNNDNDPYDDNSHGTHCAGTIAAVGNNGIGVVGVNWRARVMPLKFLGAEGWGTTAEAARAVLYATSMGARVMSNSWGGGGMSQALKDAIDAANAAGVVFVAAAGNSAGDNDVSPSYPASYDCPNIIAVAATDSRDELADFSCYGLLSVDIGAPGVGILSTVPNGGYASYSGTSMATPHVAGAAALAFSHAPSKSHTAVIDSILKSAVPVSSLQGRVATGGRLNIERMFDSGGDSVPPAAVSDLSVLEERMSRVTLRWTATGDDGASGRASAYEIRCANEPITESNWGSARRGLDAAVAECAENKLEAVVRGLSPATHYYFGLKAKDESGNASSLSNIVGATTASGATVFSDDGEGNGAFEPTGLWHRTQYRSHSPSSAWYYGNEGSWNYETGSATAGSLASQDIDLGPYGDAVLAFACYREVESYTGPYDVTLVEASRDGGANWEAVWRRDSSTPSSSAWEDSGIVQLSAYAGDKVRLRFSFNSGDANGNDYEGWYVDDIRVVAEVRDDAGEANRFVHSVKLMVNKDRFERGEELVLSAEVARAPVPLAPVCDAYLAVSLPDGRKLFMGSDRTFSPKPVPAFKNFRVRDMEKTIGRFTVPYGAPEGSYSWFAVLTPPLKRSARSSGWASNLSETTFNVNR